MQVDIDNVKLRVSFKEIRDLKVIIMPLYVPFCIIKVIDFEFL